MSFPPMIYGRNNFAVSENKCIGVWQKLIGKENEISVAKSDLSDNKFGWFFKKTCLKYYLHFAIPIFI